MENIDFENYDVNDHYDVYKEKYQFFKLGYNIVEEPKLKRNIVLYLFLRRHIRRVRSDKDILNIFENYYVKRRLLACSWPMDTLAKILSVSKRTIYRWVNELRKVGAIKIEKTVYNGRKQNVYVLGEIGEDFEIYYYEKTNF